VVHGLMGCVSSERGWMGEGSGRGTPAATREIRGAWAPPLGSPAGGPPRPDVQGILNENAQLLAALRTKAREGKSQEGSVLQQRLHNNLCYLASLAVQGGAGAGASLGAGGDGSGAR